MLLGSLVPMAAYDSSAAVTDFKRAGHLVTIS